MSSDNKFSVNPRPVVDEWGMYDPARAGLAAVLERMDGEAAAKMSSTDPRVLATRLRAATTLSLKK